MRLRAAGPAVRAAAHRGRGLGRGRVGHRRVGCRRRVVHRGSGAAAGPPVPGGSGSTKGLSKAQIAAGLRVVNGHIVKSLNAGPNKFLRADGLVSASKDIDGIPLPELLSWVLVAAVALPGDPPRRDVPEAALGARSGATGTGTRGQPVSVPVVRRAGRLRRWLVVAGAMALGVSLLSVLGVSTSPSLATVSAGAAAACHSDGGLGCTATSPARATSVPPSMWPRSPISSTASTSSSKPPASRPATPCGWPSARPPPPSLPTRPTRPASTACGRPTTGRPPRSPSPRTRPRPTCPKCRCRPSSTRPARVTRPMPSHDVLNAKGAGKGFYCDDGANPCALEVTEEVGHRCRRWPP